MLRDLELIIETSKRKDLGWFPGENPDCAQSHFRVLKSVLNSKEFQKLELEPDKLKLLAKELLEDPVLADGFKIFVHQNICDGLNRLTAPKNTLALCDMANELLRSSTIP